MSAVLALVLSVVALFVGYVLGCAATRAVWRRALRTLARTWREAVGKDDDATARAIRAMAASIDGLGGGADVGPGRAHRG